MGCGERCRGYKLWAGDVVQEMAVGCDEMGEDWDGTADITAHAQRRIHMTL